MVPSTTTPAPTPPPTPCDNSTGSCSVFEDPHINVFDGAQISLLAIASATRRSVGDSGTGDKWLVRSGHVSIQARYMARSDTPERNLFVRAIAVGGDFLDGNTLVIGSLEDPTTWNGEPILQSDSSSFIAEGDFFVNATRG